MVKPERRCWTVTNRAARSRQSDDRSLGHRRQRCWRRRQRWHGTVRDRISWLLNYLPPVKRCSSSRCVSEADHRSIATARCWQAKQNIAGRQNVYPAEGHAENGLVTLLDEVIGARPPLSLGLQPAMGAECRADSPVAQVGSAVYSGGAGGTDSLRSGQRARRYPRLAIRKTV